jgi:hypothetical protein
MAFEANSSRSTVVGGVCLLAGVAAGWALGQTTMPNESPTTLAVRSDARGESSGADSEPSSMASASVPAPRLPASAFPNADAGSPAADHGQGSSRLGTCLVDAFRSEQQMLNWVREAHQRARADCHRMLGLENAAGSQDPRAPCGDLTEELWGRASDDVTGVLRAVRDLSGEGTGALLGAMWRDTDCRAMSDRDFGAALHLASLAPAWTDPDFVACAVERESSRESFPLWAALDAATAVPGSGGWVQDDSFHDDRTLRRVRRLRGVQERGARPPERSERGE